MPKLTRRLRVPAIIDPSDLDLVEETMTEYRNAAQYVLDHGIANKLVNWIKLNHQTYEKVREQSDLNSQLLINAVDVLTSHTTFQRMESQPQNSLLRSSQHPKF